MLTGPSACGAARWTLTGDPGSTAACNLVLHRRYGRDLES
jgi:hypothetical protein